LQFKYPEMTFFPFGSGKQRQLTKPLGDHPGTECALGNLTGIINDARTKLTMTPVVKEQPNMTVMVTIAPIVIIMRLARGRQVQTKEDRPHSKEADSVVWNELADRSRWIHRVTSEVSATG
jgi:hypothetical protein